jgi:hypothetical protein
VADEPAPFVDLVEETEEIVRELGDVVGLDRAGS